MTNEVGGNAMKVFALLFCTLLFAGNILPQDTAPKKVEVPDSATAVKIAEAALIPVYGRGKIESERPFTAILKDGVWKVFGTLHCSDGKGGTTTHCVGGTAWVKLSMNDGRVLLMGHGK
ncbi:MAG: NTF2 fold immunity protein [Candidatus Acidiferrales bacterium]